MGFQEVKKNDFSIEEKDNFSIAEEYESSIGETYKCLFNRMKYNSSIGEETNDPSIGKE